MANDKNISADDNEGLVSEVENNPMTDPPRRDNEASNRVETGPPKPKAPRRRTKPKPLVEGINAPVQSEPQVAEPAAAEDKVAPEETAPLTEPVAMDVTPAPKSTPASTVVPPKITLTNSEKELIGEVQAAKPKGKPNIFTPSNPQKITLPKKSSGARKFVWSMLISLLAVSLVLGVLFWYNSESGGNLNQALNLFPKRGGQSQPPASNEAAGTADNAPQQDMNNDTAAVAPAATTTPATTTPAATQPSAKQVTITATPTGYLNVRSTPSTSGQLVIKVSPGQTFTYTETKNGWYHITLNDGSTGWVIGQYVQVVK